MPFLLYPSGKPRNQKPKSKPYVERLIRFKPLERYEMIVEWHPSLNRNPRIQRLGFKASGDFAEVCKEAQRLVEMLRKAFCQTLTEMQSADMCRLVAVYEERAFKDYADEPLYNKETQRQKIKAEIAKTNITEPISRTTKAVPKQIRVRSGKPS